MPNTPRLRSALWLPLFDELSDPVVVARIAVEAEDAGWHGPFAWDHLSWRAPVHAVADPWITLAAIATVTETLQIGPMVTPLPRRRPTTGVRGQRPPRVPPAERRARGPQGVRWCSASNEESRTPGTACPEEVRRGGGVGHLGQGGREQRAVVDASGMRRKGQSEPHTQRSGPNSTPVRG